LLELLSLPCIALKVKLQELLWQRSVQKNYYRNLEFKKYDQTLLNAYSDETPYEVSKRFMMQRGVSDVYVYGETPLKLYDQIAKRWGLNSTHRFVELGCGRGRGLFFLTTFYGCESLGIEWIFEFVQKSRDLHHKVKIYHEDFITSCHLQGDFIYLYGTCLHDEEIIQLCARFLQLNFFPKIITVSFALSEYHEAFKIEDRFEGVFPWGKGTVFLNKRRL
jgi:hypothetical protein